MARECFKEGRVRGCKNKKGIYIEEKRERERQNERWEDIIESDMK